jgi:hypothetical protein
MPPVQVYAIDFSNGNLVPSIDTNGWGSMKQGNSGPNDKPESDGDARGLNLSVYRAPGSVLHAANGVHLVFGQGVLPLATRLLMQVEFDRPNAHPRYVQQPWTVAPAPIIPGPPTPEPWAVGLPVKFGNENEIANESLVAVTCQFNRQTNGVRLNTPFNEEKDQSPNLVSPLDYAANPPPVFLMEHSFCGIRAAEPTCGRSIGSGSLTIGPPGTKKDQRVYSNIHLSGGQQTWIGALGVILVTIQGTGQIMVRLRRFSISTWS